MGVVMRDYFFKDDVDGSKDGHLPKMAVASKGMMVSLMVSSFCECITSCTNLVCPKNNSVREGIQKTGSGRTKNNRRTHLLILTFFYSYSI